MWILLLLFWADPASFDTALRTGLEALHDKNLPVARARLEDASKIQPNNPKVWLGLAQTYWKLKLADLAQSAAAKAQSADPENPVVLHGLAYFYTESGDPAKAAPLEARYAEKAPRDRDAFRARSISICGRLSPSRRSNWHARPLLWKIATTCTNYSARRTIWMASPNRRLLKCGRRSN